MTFWLYFRYKQKQHYYCTQMKNMIKKMTRPQDTLGKFYSSTQEYPKSKTEQHIHSDILLQKLYVCNKKNCCFHYATKTSHMHLTQ